MEDFIKGWKVGILCIYEKFYDNKVGLVVMSVNDLGYIVIVLRMILI